MVRRKLPESVRKCAVECGAMCCKYVTIKIPAPRWKCDIDEIRWFLAHENITVFIESRLWYVQFAARCRFLNSSNLCSIYGDRFETCRDYTMETCEASDGEPPIVFNTTEEFDEFIEERKRKRRDARRKQKKKQSR